MKTVCEKCGQDITKEVMDMYSQYQVGKITCPKCHKAQKRYLSEADFHLYFACCQAGYLAISIITKYVLSFFGYTAVSLIIPAIILIVFVLSSKWLGITFYEKGWLKEDTMNTVMTEDPAQVRKIMNTETMVFVITAIFITLSQDLFWIFTGVLFVLLGLSIYKFIKTHKAEQKQKTDSN